MDNNNNTAKSDAECLLEAEEIKNDPVRMAAASQYLEGKKEDISSIQDLKDKAVKLNEEEEMTPDEESIQADIPPAHLMTDEDRASIQKMRHYDKKSKEMLGDAKTESKLKA